jgi:limonene-1,2-epoxide hydrolase
MIKHPIHSALASRRSFITAAGAAGAAAATAAFLRPTIAKAADISEIEKANEKVVNDFCAAWESLDPDQLGSFLADDATFRMIESRPRVDGREAIINGIKGFLANAKSARFEMIRSTVMGNTVLNERIDHFDMGENKMAFHITGFFLVKDGKIIEWQDYTWPVAE